MTTLIDLYYKTNTLDEITAFEESLGIKLPPKYRQFLLETNGGEPEPNCFDIPSFSGKYSIVDFFHGLNVSTSFGNLHDEITRGREYLPSQFLPIGMDPGGNVICAGLEIPYLDKLYFWDHEDSLDSRGLPKLDMSNMYWLADDIYDFLDKLWPEVS